MDSYLNLLQHKRRRFESPAKVFAKLKSKVQREEGLWAKEGTFLANGPLCNVSEKHGGTFKSPRKRAESIWMTDELKENPRSGSYRNEAQALTLSPLSSPQKTFEYSDLSSAQVSAIAPVTEMGHGGIPRKRAFMESTTLSHQSFLVNRKQIHTEPPHVRDRAAFRVVSRTPVKLQPVEDDYVSSVFEEKRAPLDKLMSPACVSSPTRKRGKWEPLDFNKVSRGSKEDSNESTSQPKERKTSSAVSEDCSTSVEDVGNVRGFSVPPTEMDEVTYEPVFSSPGPTLIKRSYVALEQMPPMSPAKMFALMKKRENKPKPQEVHEVSSSTTDPFHAGNSHQSRDTPPPSTPHKMFEMEDIVFRSLPENVVPGNRSRVETADCQWNTDSSEDVLSPAVPSQPVLLIDPLVLNSPHISIPKKQDAVFKRRNWPQSTKYPRENVIYLKKWFLRGSRKGLFVDGIHQEENIPWNSNIIVDRVSSNVVKTVSHKVYVLVGKMNMSVDSGLPKWLLKEFVNGFPPNWETLYESFMSKSDSNKEMESKTKGRGVMSKAKSEATSSIRTAKQHRRNSLRTPDSCQASSSRVNVSRSGRVIKPPLEYWKGGRVILDAHMNVTIHECYDTSICVPEISTKMSTRSSQKPAHGFLPCSEGRKRFASASDKEASVASRRVKAPLRKCASAKVQPEKKPSYSPEPPVETLNSPEQWSGRPTMSSRRSRVTNTTLYVDTVPQKQSEPDSPITTRSKKQTHNIPRSSVRVMSRKQVVPAPESGNDVIIEKKKPGKEVHRKRSRRVLNKSRSSLFPSSESSKSSDEIEKELGTQTKHKWNKCTKSSSPTKPLPKSAQSSKKKGKATKGNAPVPQEQDADEWTEAELKMLQEAASYYPKHMAGYWAKVARMVGTRSAEECNYQHTSQAASQTPAKKAKKPKKEAVEAPKDPDQPVISARVGTFKRKQQVRQFLETMPREDVEDVFSSAYMQNKRYEMPSMCPSEHDFTLSEMQPLTPKSTGFPEVKTPQCLHITPGMMGSPNRDNDDKYVYQLQKRMKKNQFNVCKQAPSSKSFTPTPSVKRTMRRCGNTENDTFLVWEMFPGNDGALSESGEEEDFYFSDND